MDKFMEGTKSIQEGIIIFSRQFEENENKKNTYESEIKAHEKDNEEKIKELRNGKNEILAQLKQIREYRKAHKPRGPFLQDPAKEVDRAKEAEQQKLEQKIIEINDQISSLNTELKKHKDSAHNEIMGDKSRLKESLKNFISESLAEIQAKKGELEIEAKKQSFKNLAGKRESLEKEKREYEQRVKKWNNPNDQISKHLTNSVIPELQKQIDEIDSLNPYKLNEDWIRLDDIESALKAMQEGITSNMSAQQTKTTRRGIKRRAKQVEYDIIDGFKKVQEELDKVDPNLRESVLKELPEKERKAREKAEYEEAKRSEKAKYEEAKKRAKAKHEEDEINKKAEYEKAKRNAKAKYEEAKKARKQALFEQIEKEVEAAEEARKAAMAVTGDLIDHVTQHGQLSDDQVEEPLEPEKKEAKTKRLEDTIIVGPDDIEVEDNPEHSNDEHDDNQNEGANSSDFIIVDPKDIVVENKEENPSDFIMIDPEDARVGNDAEVINLGDLPNSTATPKKEAPEARKATAPKAFEEGKKQETEEAKRKAKEEKKTGFWTRIKIGAAIVITAVAGFIGGFLFGKHQQLPAGISGTNPAQETEAQETDPETVKTIAQIDEEIRRAELREGKIVDNHEVYHQIKEEAEKAKEANNFKDELKVETKTGNPIGKRIILPGNTVLAPTAYLNEGEMGNSNNIAGGKSVTDSIVTGVHAIDRKTGKRTEFDPSKSTYEDWLAEVKQSDMVLSYDISRPNKEGKMTHIGYVSKDTYDMIRTMEKTSQRRKGNGMGR